MNTLRSSLLVLAAVSVVAGCFAEKGDESGAQSDDLVAARAWSATNEATHFLAFAVSGSGEVPAGAECAPGTLRMTLYPGALSADAGGPAGGPRMNILECRGEPLRLRGRSIVLTDDALAAALATTRAVTTSDSTTCDGAGNAPYTTLTVGANDGDAGFAQITYSSNRYGCEPGRYAAGIEAAAAFVRALADAVPPTAPTVVAASVPATQLVWSDTTSYLTLVAAGHGSTPQGSTCIRGARTYSLSKFNEGFFLSRSTCEPTADGRLRTVRPAPFAFSANESSAILAALRSAYAGNVGSCEPGAEYLSASAGGKTAEGQPETRQFMSRSNACAIDADQAPYANLEPLRAALDTISAAHP